MFYVVSVHIYVFLNHYWVKQGMKKTTTTKKKNGGSTTFVRGDSVAKTSLFPLLLCWKCVYLCISKSLLSETGNEKNNNNKKQKPEVNHFCEGRRCGENLVVPAPRPPPNFKGKALKINILLLDLKTGGGERGTCTQAFSGWLMRSANDEFKITS